MAALYGDNYTANYISVPQSQAKAGEVGGIKRVLLDQKAGASAADTIALGKLPKGARVLELKSIGAGSGASFNVTAGAILSAETDLVITVGTGPSATVIAWAEYVID